MILETINKPPFIHFGFNQQSKTIALGDSVTIWQDTLYNGSIQKLDINGTIKPNQYKNDFIPDAIGTFEFESAVFIGVNKIEGNTITLIVE